jgi:hypothetical protein
MGVDPIEIRIVKLDGTKCEVAIRGSLAKGCHEGFQETVRALK